MNLLVVLVVVASFVDKSNFNAQSISTSSNQGTGATTGTKRKIYKDSFVVGPTAGYRDRHLDLEKRDAEVYRPPRPPRPPRGPGHKGSRGKRDADAGDPGRPGNKGSRGKRETVAGDPGNKGSRGKRDADAGENS